MLMPEVSPGLTTRSVAPVPARLNALGGTDQPVVGIRRVNGNAGDASAVIDVGEVWLRSEGGPTRCGQATRRRDRHVGVHYVRCVDQRFSWSVGRLAGANVGANAVI